MSSPEVVALREFIEQQIHSLSERVNALVENHRREHELLAVQVIREAEVINRRLEGMNELRSQLTSERATYASREQVEQRFQQLTQLTDLHYAENGKRISELEKARANLDGRLATVAAALVIIQIALSIAAHFWR